jgi:hypothetical protein
MFRRAGSVLACLLLLNLLACGDDDDSAADGGSAGKAGSGGKGSSNGGGGGRAGGAGAGGRAGSGNGGAGGSHAAGSGGDAGSEEDAGTDKMLGNTGLRVSDILGFYSGDWGDMVLRTHGDEIWGAYQHDEGTVVGKINTEGVFVGWWSEVPTRETPNDAGDVEFRWARGTTNAIALDGRWRYGTTENWREDWDVELVTDRDVPPEISDRFSMPDAFKRKP